MKNRQRAELEAARRKHAEQAAALAAVDKSMDALRDARERAEEAVTVASEVFGEEELAGFIGLTPREVRAMIKVHLQRKRVITTPPAPADGPTQLGV